jgi:hypothetical protein
LPSDLTLYVRTVRLSGSATVLPSNCNNAGIWFEGLSPALVGAIAIESRSMKVVWRATSRCEAVLDEAMFHNQGRSSGQTPLSSSKRAMVETRRADAVRAWELQAPAARVSRSGARATAKEENALGLGEEKVKEAGLEGGADLLRLREPLLVLLGGNTLAELDERELPDLERADSVCQLQDPLPRP